MLNKASIIGAFFIVFPAISSADTEFAYRQIQFTGGEFADIYEIEATGVMTEFTFSWKDREKFGIDIGFIDGNDDRQQYLINFLLDDYTVEYRKSDEEWKVIHDDGSCSKTFDREINDWGPCVRWDSYKTYTYDSSMQKLSVFTHNNIDNSGSSHFLLRAGPAYIEHNLPAPLAGSRNLTAKETTTQGFGWSSVLERTPNYGFGFYMKMSLFMGAGKASYEGALYWEGNIDEHDTPTELDQSGKTSLRILTENHITLGIARRFDFGSVSGHLNLGADLRQSALFSLFEDIDSDDSTAIDDVLSQSYGFSGGLALQF